MIFAHANMSLAEFFERYDPFNKSHRGDWWPMADWGWSYETANDSI